MAIMTIAVNDDARKLFEECDELSGVAKSALVRSVEPLANDLDLAAGEFEVEVKVTLTELRKLKAIAKRFHVDDGVVLRRLMLEGLGFDSGASDAITESANDFISLAGLSNRDEQQLMLSRMRSAMAGNHKMRRAVFSEASVGVGKSMVLASLAFDAVQAGQPAVIAAPSYLIAQSLYEAVLSLANACDVIASDRVVLRLSRREFVSHDRVEHFLANATELPDGVRASVESLLERGVYEKHEFAKAGIDVTTLALSSSSRADDPGYLAYLSHSDEVSDKAIVICTHSLVIHAASRLQQSWWRSGNGRHWKTYHQRVDVACAEQAKEVIEFARAAENKRTSGRSAFILPDNARLLIDEADAFKNMAMAMRANTFSFNTFIHSVEQLASSDMRFGSCAGKPLSALLSWMSDSCDVDVLTRSDVETLRKLMIDLMPPDRLHGDHYAGHIMDAIETVGDMAISRQPISVRKSPVRGNLSLWCGSSFVADLLTTSWAMSRDVAFVSGTLANTDDVNTCYRAVKSDLCVVDEVMESRFIPPIESSWLRENVTVRHPKPHTQHRSARDSFAGTMFWPPGYDGEEYKPWCKRQAEWLGEYVQSRLGGVLVFCTSYDQVDLLAKLINESGSLNDDHRLLVDRQSVSSQLLASQYESHYSDGNRPIWLTVYGAAGKGMSLSDMTVDPSDDHMVSSVVLTRLPFPTVDVINNASSKYVESVNTAYMNFRQAIGRLIRRPGRTNAELVLLDGRGSVTAGRSKVFWSYLSGYNEKIVID